MEHLWAPWRMAYINSGSEEQGCIFCTKPADGHDEEHYILYRSQRCFVMLNIFPYNNGHLMIVPFQHVPSIEGLDTATLTDLMATAQLCLRAFQLAMQPHGFNMGINQGKVAGAGIADHVHFHIVPRWNGDTNFMPVLADVKVMPDYLRNTYQQLRRALASLTNPSSESDQRQAR
ncbi:MAG TPA: HIT domain-containing protein [Ktedonobacterales bacterium]